MESLGTISYPVVISHDPPVANGAVLNGGSNVNECTSNSGFVASCSLIMCLLSKLSNSRFVCSCLPTFAVVTITFVMLLMGKNYVKYCLLWLDTQEEWIVCTVFLILYTAVSFPLTWGYILLNLACGYHFGLFAGILVTAIAASVGIMLAHVLMKHYFIGIITAKLFGINVLHSTLAILQTTHAFKLIAISRLTPIPFGLQNALFAVSPICLWRYVSASALGLLPTQVISVYLGTTVRSMEDVLVDQGNASMSYGIFMAQVLLSVSLFLVILRRARHELSRTMSSDLKEVFVQKCSSSKRPEANFRLNFSYLTKQLPYRWGVTNGSRCVLQKI